MTEIDEKKKTGIRTLTRIAFLTALSLIAYIIESLFPPLVLPGAKMGLGNIFSMLALTVMGVWQGYAVVLARTLLGAALTGSLSTLLYSLSAGLVSYSLSALLFRCFGKNVSITAISIAAGVCHNLVQNAVFVFVSGTRQMLGYAPYLALLGIPAGFTVGVAVTLLMPKVKSFFSGGS